MQIAVLARAWARHGWLVIGILWVAALALGLIGFALSAPAGRPSDVAYRTLQLIAMNSGDVADAPLPLDIARFMVPLLTTLTALRALLSLFHDRWQTFLLRFWRNHIVICGLSRKGWLLAQGFIARGWRVVVIEADDHHDLIGPCRERGAVVLNGDATDPEVLQRAGAARAAHVIAVTDDDGINAEVAVRCYALLNRTRRTAAGALICTVHLVDPELYELARSRELALEEQVPLELRLFNVFDQGGRLLWARYGAAPTGHILVIGLGDLGESLVITAVQDWARRQQQSPGSPPGRLRVSVVDAHAETKCRALMLRHPELAHCHLAPYTTNVGASEFYTGDFLDGGAAGESNQAKYPPVSVAFVCFDNDTLSLRTGLTIRQMLLRRGATATPVIVRMAEAGGLARLVDPDGDGEPVAAFDQLHIFPLLDRTCTPEVIVGAAALPA